MIKCEFCGHESPDELSYCGKCGRALPKPSTPAQEELERPDIERLLTAPPGGVKEQELSIPAIVVSIVIIIVFAAIIWYLVFPPESNNGGGGPPQQGEWTYMRTFSGSGDTTTDTFHCDNKCKFEWTVYGDPDWTYWYAFVYPEGSSIYTGQWDTDRPSTGTSYFYHDGNFYFVIGSANVDSWEIIVYDWE